MSYRSEPQYGRHRATRNQSLREQQFQGGSVDVQHFVDSEGFAGVMNRPSVQRMPQDPTPRYAEPYQYTQEHPQFSEVEWVNDNDDSLNPVPCTEYPSITVDGVTMEGHVDVAAHQSFLDQDTYHHGTTLITVSDHSAYAPSSSMSGVGNGPWNPLQGSTEIDCGFDGSLTPQHGILSPQYLSRLPSQDEYSSGSNAIATSASVASGDLISADLGDSIMTQRQLYMSSDGMHRYAEPFGRFPVEVPCGSPIMMAPHDAYSLEPERQSGSPYHLAWPLQDASRATESQTPAGSSIVESQSTGPEIQCEYEGCFQTFTGTHRRGAMHRHMRLKHPGGHGAPEKMFLCQVASCGKSFKRPDARLKHLRNKHPELGYAAAMPRKL